MLRVLFCLLAFFALVSAVQAQETGDPASNEQYRETQALIERMRAKVKGIDNAQAARDRDIEFLNKKIEEAIGLISAGRDTNAELRDANTNFQSEIKELYETEGELNASLEEAATEREAKVSEMESRIASLVERLGEEQRSRDGLQGEVRALAARLKATEEEKERVERRQARRIEEIESLKGEIRTLKEMMIAARRRTTEQKARMDDQKSEMAEQNARLRDLDGRLKAALARKVEELSGYRSEFFGRLRQALGGRRDVRMEGDRFVFQSEVLFASGQASLDPRGREALTELARTLNEVARKIPDNLNWILRVDGHTDRLPIRTNQWLSNWELSTARALSVVKYLIEEGIRPQRLAAAGFGKFQPLDPRDDEFAYRRNRRIEFKLTQR
jgi:chemotaxis protein MotB